MNTEEYKRMYSLEDKHFWFVGKRYFVDSVLSPYTRKIKNILDLGAGTGGMTKFLEKYGKVTGIEKNKLAVSLSKKRNTHVTYGDIQNLRLKPTKFDLVTIFDVLYHKNVYDIPKILKNSHQILKPNGLILITDSAFNFLKSSHDSSVHGSRRFLLSDMVKVLIDNNFSILKKSYIYISIFPFVFFKRFFISKFIQHNNSDVQPV
jgi:SAM-dependent methyltransferase